MYDLTCNDILENVKKIEDTYDEIVNLYMQMSYVGFADRMQLARKVEAKREKLQDYDDIILTLIEDIMKDNE